ncbi:Stage V sporulation K-like protein [Cladobotryum mycophilum]|uniref:Stage V sporulation K-like protein n=1 Tax=Cladobotryum mycophilum TaxID=491253 RepID=A0ABR0T248_9HYPO
MHDLFDTQAALLETFDNGSGYFLPVDYPRASNYNTPVVQAKHSSRAATPAKHDVATSNGLSGLWSKASRGMASMMSLGPKHSNALEGNDGFDPLLYRSPENSVVPGDSMTSNIAIISEQDHASGCNEAVCDVITENDHPSQSSDASESVISFEQGNDLEGNDAPEYTSTSEVVNAPGSINVSVPSDAFLFDDISNTDNVPLGMDSHHDASLRDGPSGVNFVQQMRDESCEGDASVDDIAPSKATDDNTNPPVVATRSQSTPDDGVPPYATRGSILSIEDGDSSDSDSQPDHSAATSPETLPFDPFSTPKLGPLSRSTSFDDIPPLDDDFEVETHAKSPAEREWQRRKGCGEKNHALDNVMKMVGLEAVKVAFLDIKWKIDQSRSLKIHLKRHDLNLILLGNPGTGKRTLAKFYYDFLVECGVWNASHSPRFQNLTSRELHEHPSLMHADAATTGWHLDSSLTNPGMILVVTDAEFVDPQELVTLTRLMENAPKDLVMVLAGFDDHTHTLLNRPPAAGWRRIDLPDYEDDELHQIFMRLVAHDAQRIESASSNPLSYSRVLIDRIKRNQRAARFRNAHALRSVYDDIRERQALRLQHDLDLKTQQAKDLSLLTRSDILGSEPEDLLNKSEAWKELRNMAGLKGVKSTCRQLLSQAKINYQRELEGFKPSYANLHRVFVGPPGTGKTTVAKLYGQIVADSGLVSGREVVLKIPTDFICHSTKETETKTTAILESTRDKILIIDNAHMFYSGSRSGTPGDLACRQAAIDLIVSNIDNRPDADQCIIFTMMEDTFHEVNSRLSWRFPLQGAFRFGNYDDAMLKEILELKMKEGGITATEAALKVAVDVLKRAADLPSFGNGGEVVNLLEKAKGRQRLRLEKIQASNNHQNGDTGRPSLCEVSHMPSHTLDPSTLQLEPATGWDIALESEDFDPDFDRDDGAGQRWRALLGAFSESKDKQLKVIIDLFESYPCIAQTARHYSQDPKQNIPFTYIFKGPPGSGKTYTAGTFGHLFYGMGLLYSDEVMECSTSDLVGKCIDHKGSTVIDILEKALGKVLLIDYSCRMGPDRESSVAEDAALRELVDCMIRPRWHRKMVVVLTGYEQDIDGFMKTNQGLYGRFGSEIVFPAMSEQDCLRYLRKLLKDRQIELPIEVDTGENELERIYRGFSYLKTTTGWSNGRDVEEFSKKVIMQVYSHPERFVDKKTSSLRVKKSEILKMLETYRRGNNMTWKEDEKHQQAMDACP